MYAQMNTLEHFNILEYLNMSHHKLQKRISPSVINLMTCCVLESGRVGGWAREWVRGYVLVLVL